MVDCSPAAKKSKPRKRVPHLIAVSKGFIPDGRYPDETARVNAHLMRVTSVNKDYRNGDHIHFSFEKLRSMFGGTKAGKIKDATEDSDAFEWKHKSRKGEFSESVRLSNRSGEFDLHEVTMKVRASKPKSANDNLMSLGEVGMALTARQDHFYIAADAVPQSAWEHYTIERIRNGDIYSMRGTHRRFFSSFSNLSKHTKKHSLRAKSGDSLVSIDIANCQPLLLGVLASQSPCSFGTRSKPNSTPYRRTLNAWLDVTQKGEVYEFSAERLTELTGKKWEARPEAKDLFMPFMFGEVRLMKFSPLIRVFESDFQLVLDFIRSVKRYRHAEMAHILHELEAEIMIDGVSAKFMRRYPDAPILTIHDELIVPVQHRDEVCDIIRAEFGKYAVTPTIK